MTIEQRAERPDREPDQPPPPDQPKPLRDITREALQREFDQRKADEPGTERQAKPMPIELERRDGPTDDGGDIFVDFDPERAEADPLYLKNFLHRIVGEFAERGEAKDRDVPDSYLVERRPLPAGMHGIVQDHPVLRDSNGNASEVPSFNGVPKREEAIQTNLRDCWLSSSMRAVAGHRPQDIIDVLSENANGNLDVRLHQMRLDRATGDWVPTGRRISMEVTRDVPLHPTNPDNAYFTDTENSKVFWPAALQKAFSSVEPTWSTPRKLAAPARGYERLDRGGNEWQMAEVLGQLTGERAGVVELDTAPGNEAQTEAVLQNQVAAGRPVVIGTLPSSHPRNFLPHDLRGAHAYEITTVANGQVELRNPWGDFHPQPMTVRELLDNTRGMIATLKS